MATGESVTPGDEVEHWLPAPRWEEFYQVSDRGRVRSLDRVVSCGLGRTRTARGKIMHPWTDKTGRAMVTLQRLGKTENIQVSDLVEDAFNPQVEAAPNPDEHWLPVPVPGFEEWYDVSDLGRVRSYHGGQRWRGKPRILKPVLKKNGYLMVTLRQDGRTAYACVHVLVLTAFVGPRPAGDWIEGRHGPAGKLDNSVANLCWGTMKENHLDRIRDDAVVWGERHVNHKLTAAAVLDCRRRFASGETLTALAKEYGMSMAGLSQAVNGVTWAQL